MTDPIEPTPGAPAGTATQSEATEPPAPTPPWERDGTPFDPARAWTTIEKLRADLTKAQTTRNQQAEREARKAVTAEMTSQVARALGLAEEPPDPQALMAQIEEARNNAWVSAVELHLHRAAATLGADAEAMLDSRAFLTTLDDLVDMDPSSPEFREQIQAKVQEAAAKYPAKNAGQAPSGPRPDPSQGARGNGQTRPKSLGEAIGQHYAAKR